MKLRAGKFLDERTAFLYAQFFLMLLFSSFLLSCLGFLLGTGISAFHFPLSLACSSILFVFLAKEVTSILAALKHLLLIFLFLLLIYFLCINVFDTSYDGLWYHQPAIIRLADGWNPVADPFYPTNQYDESNYTWIQHYAKASWITASCIYKMTGFVESGKMINFIAVAAVFFYSYSVFCRLFKGGLMYTLAFSLVISLNPVTVSQLLSDYLDGLLAGMLSLITLSLLNMQLKKDGSARQDWFILIPSLILATNLKFTGLFMAGIIIAVFSLYWWWKKEPVRDIFRKYILIGVVAVSAFFLFGFNPYYTNWQYKGHVFYPLNTKSKYAVLLQNEPVSLRGRSNLSNLFISVFSQAENNIQAKEIRWKNPLIVTKEELRAFAGTDVRVGGHGPFFLLAFLSSIVVALSLFKELRKEYKVLLCISLAAILLSVVFVPMAWWSRYIPHFFLLPVLLAIFSGLAASNQKNLLKKYAPAGLLLILVLNLCLIAAPSFAANRIKTRLIKEEMSVLKARKTPLMINFSKTEFQALRTRLKEAGISFTDNDTLTTNVRELRSIYNLYGYGPVYNIGD